MRLISCFVIIAMAAIRAAQIWRRTHATLPPLDVGKWFFSRLHWVNGVPSGRRPAH